MKFSNKKLVELFILVLIANLQLSLGARKENEKQINQVIDTRGFNTNLQTVVNRNPTVETLNRGSNFRLGPMPSVVEFSNSNTSNSPNVGNLGTTAEIVDPHIVIQRTTPFFGVKETPVHIGNRNEKTSITSYNLDNGKVESHTVNRKVPLYGTMQQAEPLYKTDIINYNLRNNNYERSKTYIEKK